MVTKKKETLSFKVDTELKEKITERANEEQRTVSNLVIKILTDYINKIDEAKKIINMNK